MFADSPGGSAGAGCGMISFASDVGGTFSRREGLASAAAPTPRSSMLATELVGCGLSSGFGICFYFRPLIRPPAGRTTLRLFRYLQAFFRSPCLALLLCVQR